MFLRIIIFLLGILFIVTGFISIILYLNLLSFGYSFLEYVNFIIRRFETYYFIIGFIILSLTLILPGGKKYEFYL